MDKDKLAKAFTEWERRFLENPTDFVDHAAGSTSDYGEACAAYLLKLLAEV